MTVPDPHEHTRQRRDDELSSSAGARDVSRRAPNQKMRLLAEYSAARQEEGLTDEEAAGRAGLLEACYWKRCNELRQDGLIRYVDCYRKGKAGVMRRASVITYDGTRELVRRVIRP